MMVNKLTNVDFILLYLLGQGRSARRCDIMDAAKEWRNGTPLGAMYFARYKRQSPYYTFDVDQSEFKTVNTGSYHRRKNDAKVSMWRLTGRGLLRACRLRREIAQGCIRSACS